MNKNDLEALRALEADASELERIKSLSNRFNVFEDIGFVDQELMHSNFLASLLDPRKTHGLGDVFLRRLLDRASLSLDLREKDLAQTLVHRERRNVDILLTNETHRVAVIIENKIWTSEHSDQLDRYHKQVKKDHPDWHVLAIYLTPYGSAPSHEAYSSLSYQRVCEVLDEVLEEAGSMLASNVRMAIQQYTEMVRRNIVGDSEVTKLCQQIYQRHKRALDLIYEHRPDTQARIQDIVEGLIREEPRLDLDYYRGKNKIKFGVRNWDTVALLSSEGWTPSKRILLLEVWNYPDSLDLHLFMGPGSEATRQRLVEMARANPEVFVAPRNVNAKWLPIFSRNLLGQGAYEDLDDEEREQEIHRQWAAFLEEDLPRIEAALKKESWIWESVEADE